MNILYYLDEYPKLSESFILNEIAELDARGHNVAVFALNNPEENITHSEVKNLQIETYYAKKPSYSNITDVADPRIRNLGLREFVRNEVKPKHAAYHLHLALQCVDFVNALPYEIDIIHGHFATHTKLGGRYAANYFDLPFTVTAHAYEIFLHDQRDTAKQVLTAVDQIVVPSEYNKKFLKEILGVDNLFNVVYATTDVDNFTPTDDECPKRLLTIARLVEKKGYEYSLQAVSRLVDEYPDIEYHIIGEGPLKDDLIELTTELGISENIQFLGHVTDDRLHQELNEASIFVLPCAIAKNGDRDVIPVALKEAMAMETPCISTPISGISEMIKDNENGILVPDRDSEELAQAMATLFETPEQRRRLGTAGRETIARKFDIESAVDDLTATFKKSVSSLRH
ncbi:glycosyltransferase [Natrinema salifodinae]|uniref:glycosyltransferase n=1 Tax=Natrinema salifodinae TaxID=1202768 RepID=UPI0009DED83D|nr:glycosyltransferase [Natrinema salifodinae]